MKWYEDECEVVNNFLKKQAFVRIGKEVDWLGTSNDLGIFVNTNQSICILKRGFLIDDFKGKYLVLPFYSDIEVSDSDSFDCFSVGLAGDGSKFAVPSCFFICVADAFHLNSKFTKVGKVISGFEELKRIESVELVDVPNNDSVAFKTPVNDEIIDTITIDLKDYKVEKCNKYLL